jgi:hypothetical protein
MWWMSRHCRYVTYVCHIPSKRVEACVQYTFISWIIAELNWNLRQKKLGSAPPVSELSVVLLFNWLTNRSATTCQVTTWLTKETTRKPNSTRHGYDLDNCVTLVYSELKEKDTRTYSLQTALILLQGYSWFCGVQLIHGFDWPLPKPLALSISAST